VRLIDDAGAPLAVLIHDPDPLEDPALLAGIAAATRLELLADSDPQLVAVKAGLAAARRELRELARGIHPATLTDTGLSAALTELAARSLVPVNLTAAARTWPPAIEAAAYFICSEALANITKHAHATHADIHITNTETALRGDVADDGAGGAKPCAGSGLRGLQDRAETLGVHLTIASPDGQGTHLIAVLPIPFTLGGRQAGIANDNPIPFAAGGDYFFGTSDTALTDLYASNDNPFFSGDPNVQHAFVWHDGAITDLGALGPQPSNNSSVATSVNARGDVAGASDNGTIDPLLSDEEVNAVLWKDGKVINLGTLGGDQSVAFYLNDASGLTDYPRARGPSKASSVATPNRRDGSDSP